MHDQILESCCGCTGRGDRGVPDNRMLRLLRGTGERPRRSSTSAVRARTPPAWRCHPATGRTAPGTNCRDWMRRRTPTSMTIVVSGSDIYCAGDSINSSDVAVAGIGKMISGRLCRLWIHQRTVLSFQCWCREAMCIPQAQFNSSSVAVPGYWKNGAWNGLTPLAVAQKFLGQFHRRFRNRYLCWGRQQECFRCLCAWLLEERCLEPAAATVRIR